MSDCTCPHQDVNEPDHDSSCPARPVFSRDASQRLIREARLIARWTDTGGVMTDLATQLAAAIRVIDAVPTDVLALAMLPKVPR